MLFTAGKRPDRAAFREFANVVPQISVTHDPARDERKLWLIDPGDSASREHGQNPGDCEPVWLEVLRDGLTFDCVGIAPREPSVSPTVKHRFDIDSDTALDRFEAVLLTPGAHLTGGDRSIPILRGLLGLARDMVHHFQDAQIACWPPSQSAIGRRFFESTVTAWLDGGPFPALGLTAFDDESDGSLVSVGLAHFIDQELRIEAELASDKLAATRLGLRLINQLVLVGGIDQSERIIGPDGSRLLLRPSRNGKFVRVSRE